MNRISWHSPSVVVFLYFIASTLIVTPCTAETQPANLNEPLVVISNIIQNPTRISSGEAFNETFVFTNFGNDTAISVLLSMNISYPFALVKSSSTLFVGDIKPGKNKSALGQMAVDKRASVGVYSISYTIQYRNSTGGSYIQQGTFGVQIFSKPQLHIKIANITQSPVKIVSGQNFTQSFRLTNVGNDLALNVQLSLDISYPFAMVNSSSSIFIGDLEPNENCSVYAKIAVDRNALVGAYSIPYTINYRDSTGDLYDQRGTFGVQIYGKPQLHIKESVSQNQTKIFPGATFKQIFNVTNVGEDRLRKVQLSITVSHPFAISNSSSNFFVGDLNPKESQSVEVHFLVDQNAIVGVYSVSFTIRYEDTSGVSYDHPGAFGVEIVGKPKLFVDSIRVDPTSLLPGQDGLMTLRLTNVGSDVALDTSITVFGGSKILTSSIAYVAKLDSKQSQSIFFPVSVSNNLDPGTYLLNITVNYGDTSNNTYQLSRLFELGVLQATPFVPYLYLGLAAGLAILTVVGYFFYTWIPSSSKEELTAKVANCWSFRKTKLEFLGLSGYLKLGILRKFSI